MINLKLINFVLFQVGWFACVLGAANGMADVGLIIALMIIMTHLFLTKNKQNEISLIVWISVMGYCWDSLLVHTDLLQYTNSTYTSFAPLWIAAMWAMFASTINTSLAWLKDKMLIAAILGAFFGPVAYYSAFKLGAISSIILPDALITQSIAWAVFMPLMLQLNKLAYRWIPPQKSEGTCN